jgi:hypothetical protein
VALAAGRRQELLELLESPDQRVALGRERRDLALPEGVSLILLRDPRLQLRLALVEILELGFEGR